MKKKLLSLCLTAVMLATSAGPLPAAAAGTQKEKQGAGEVTITGKEFTGAENRGVYAVNSENARANSYPYGDRESAREHFTLTPFEEDGASNSPYLQSLNGTWKFFYAENPGKRPWPGNEVEPGFEQAGFQDEGWDDIQVPGNWQVNWDEKGNFKYDNIIYSNSNYPWDAYGNGKVSEPATPAAFNGVGTYRRTFTVPREWRESGRSVFLNFNGADTFYVWVNGRGVGYSADSMTHHEFDITPYLNEDGENTIAVQVIRWSLGSWMEDQDFIRISGIFRDIYLLAREEVDLYDFEVQTTPATEGDYEGAWNLDVRALVRDFSGDGQSAGQEDARLHAELYDGDTLAAEYTQPEPAEFARITGGLRNPSFTGAKVDFRMQLPKPKLWSAEDPNLYQLVLWVGDEVTCVRVGFRQIQYTTGEDARILVNGSRILFYGTNLHETNPETGRTMTLDLIRKDMTTMKANNVNAVRMSHYPHDTRYYDLADELGLYIMDEANIESHGNRGITNQDAYGPAVRDRVSNMVERDKNYPSVVVWSMGNESGGGANFRKYAPDWTRQRDPQRPIHCQFDDSGAGYGNYDMISSMYTPPGDWTKTVASGKKPAVLCEYVHAMGNSNGNWDEYIRLFDEQPKSVGGFIWDWVDQSILTPVPVRENGKEGLEYYAYGGDWGDVINDNNFCANGMLLADRTPKPQVDEMKYEYRMLTAEMRQNQNVALRDAKHVDRNPSDQSGEAVTGIGDYEGIALQGWAVFPKTEDYEVYDNFTVEAWVCPGQESGNFSQIFSNGGDNGYQLRERGRNIEFIVHTENGWTQMEVAKPAGYAGAWHKVSATYQDHAMKVYVDGRLLGTKTAQGAITETSLGISAGVLADNKTRVYEGYLGGVRLLNRALTEEEIRRSNPLADSGETVFLLVPEKADTTEEPLTYCVRNKFLFTNADAYEMTWELTEDGTVLQSGTDTLDVAPAPAGVSRETATVREFPVPFTLPEELKPGAEYYFQVAFALREDTEWAPKGHVISSSQMKLFADQEKEERLARVSGEKLETADSRERVTVSGKDFTVSFDKENQVLDSYQFQGRDLLVSGPRPNFYRAPNDNDMRNGDYGSLASWKGVGSAFTDGKVRVEKAPNLVVITAEGRFQSKSGSYTTAYTIYPDGEIQVEENYDFTGLTGNTLMPEIGSMMILPPDLENITWFGRGGGESYADRKYGNPVGIWSTTVTDSFVPYIKPQDTGNRMDTRWLALTDDSGFGFIVKSGKFKSNALTRGNGEDTVEFNALHYSPEELASTAGMQRHPYELKESENTYLRINMASRGLGGDNSWGLKPHSQYVIDARGKTYRYNYSILPVERFQQEDATAYASEKHDFYESLQELIARAEAEGQAALTGEARLVKREDGAFAALTAYNELREDLQSAGSAEEMTGKGLDRLIALIESLDAEAYTPESWARVEKALEEAKEVRAREDATQAELEQAVSSLLGAYGDLAYGVQKTHLRTAVEAARELLALSGDYEETAPLAAAAEQGEIVLADRNATQEAVDEAAYAVLNELFKMARKAELGTLESLIQAAKGLLKDSYTSGSLNNLRTAIGKAEAVVRNPNRGPEEISGAYAGLVEAIMNLQMKGNKAALTAMIGKAEEILSHRDAYLASTLEGLEESLKEAKAVEAHGEAVQSGINQAVEALTLELTKVRLLGDVDGDGEITTKDIAAVLQACAELTPLSGRDKECADVNKDGVTDTRDAALILQYAAEKIAAF